MRSLWGKSRKINVEANCKIRVPKLKHLQFDSEFVR